MLSKRELEVTFIRNHPEVMRRVLQPALMVLV